mgnify:CR=1 FL=1
MIELELRNFGSHVKIFASFQGNAKRAPPGSAAALWVFNFSRPTSWHCRTKQMDWDVLERLHRKGLISDAVNKNKSLVPSNQGLQRSKALSL